MQAGQTQNGMSNDAIKRVLGLHGVLSYQTCGRIRAWEIAVNVDRHIDVSKWVDVTGWTATRLYACLGY